MCLFSIEPKNIAYHPGPVKPPRGDGAIVVDQIVCLNDNHNYSRKIEPSRRKFIKRVLSSSAPTQATKSPEKTRQTSRRLAPGVYAGDSPVSHGK